MFGFCRKTSAPVSKFEPVNIGLKAEPLTMDGGTIGQIKHFFYHPEEATKERLDALWCKSQQDTDPYPLYCAAAFFQDERMQRKATKRIESHLEKHQDLGPADLELLLDCINIGERMGVNGARLREYAKRMTRQLDGHKELADYAERLYI